MAGHQSGWYDKRWHDKFRSALLRLCCAMMALVCGLGLHHASAAATEPNAATTEKSQGKTLLVFGDSLSAAYGLARQDGWVALLEARLRTTHPQYSVVNASISGETSAGGAARIATLLKQTRPAIVIVELGANDGLRGLPIAQLRENLSRILLASHQAGARLLLVGMRMPPNYGPQYTREFADSFALLARDARHPAALVPFLFEGFAEQRERFQPDGLHPTAAAQPLMLETVWKRLRPLLP